MDNNQQTNRQKLVFYLMDKGLSNEEVAQTLSDVAEAALEQFTNEAMAVLSDADKQAIEAAPNSIEADDLIKKLYEEKSGKKADERLEQLIEEQATSYMSGSGSPDTTSSASGVSQ
jgi:hypothetical protein